MRPNSTVCWFSSTAFGHVPMKFHGLKLFPPRVIVMFRERISGTTIVTSGALWTSAYTSSIVLPTAWSAMCCCHTGMS